jgi:enoyl-CoA hydratase
MKVVVSKSGPVTTVKINRPECRNAVDPETAGMLRDAFSAFEADAASSVAVFCGAGDTFCAGYDLKSLSGSNLTNVASGDGPMGPSRALISKPVIAAVEGHAVAGGLELALWCDLRVASASAIFGVFCRRWGVPLIDGGTIRLPRLIGHSRALDMILTGRPVAAEEAHSFGLANRIVPPGKAYEHAVELARQIARFPQICVRADRMSSYEQWGLGLDEALQHESERGQSPLMLEAQNGAARFASGSGRRGDFASV